MRQVRGVWLASGPASDYAGLFRGKVHGTCRTAPCFGGRIARYLPRGIVVSHSAATAPDFTKGDGLIPAIAQDAASGDVLMLAYMNAESYAETLATGRAVYFSRSRGKLWRKGEESGNVQKVEAIYFDCDADTLLLKVHQIGGAACHEGYKSCFFRKVTPEGFEVVGERIFDPKQVYKK